MEARDMTKSAYVYILANKKRGTLYVGVTSDLERRMYQHRRGLLEGFTSKYNVTRLVWFEQGENIAAAISLEKKIKNRNRQWKINLIEKNNPEWRDLARNWGDSATPLRSAWNDRGGMPHVTQNEGGGYGLTSHEEFSQVGKNFLSMKTVVAALDCATRNATVAREKLYRMENNAMLSPIQFANHFRVHPISRNGSTMLFTIPRSDEKLNLNIRLSISSISKKIEFV